MTPWQLEAERRLAALIMVTDAYDIYMETDVLDDLAVAIGFARLVIQGADHD